MKRSKIWLSIVIAAIICFGLIPLIVNWFFKQATLMPILKPEWEAGEALGYVSGILSFIGTMFLGRVSWKQNQDLQKKQDETFAAENSCTVLLDKVAFKIGNQNACNLNIHPETIVCSSEQLQKGYGWESFECEITLQYVKNLPVLVRVLSASIFVENQVAEFVKYDECFTKVAAFKDYCKFNLTLLVSAEEKQKIGNLINQGIYPIALEIKFETVSDRYVSTTLKCRSTLEYCGGVKYGIKYSSSEDTSMSFGYGSRVLEQSEIKYRVQD